MLPLISLEINSPATPPPSGTTGAPPLPRRGRVLPPFRIVPPSSPLLVLPPTRKPRATGRTVRFADEEEFEQEFAEETAPFRSFEGAYDAGDDSDQFFEELLAATGSSPTYRQSSMAVPPPQWWEDRLCSRSNAKSRHESAAARAPAAVGAAASLIGPQDSVESLASSVSANGSALSSGSSSLMSWAPSKMASSSSSSSVHSSNPDREDHDHRRQASLSLSSWWSPPSTPHHSAGGRQGSSSRRQRRRRRRQQQQRRRRRRSEELDDDGSVAALEHQMFLHRMRIGSAGAGAGEAAGGHNNAWAGASGRGAGDAAGAVSVSAGSSRSPSSRGVAATTGMHNIHMYCGAPRVPRVNSAEGEDDEISRHWPPSLSSSSSSSSSSASSSPSSSLLLLPETHQHSTTATTRRVSGRPLFVGYSPDNRYHPLRGVIAKLSPTPPPPPPPPRSPPPPPPPPLPPPCDPNTGGGAPAIATHGKDFVSPEATERALRRRERLRQEEAAWRRANAAAAATEIQRAGRGFLVRSRRRQAAAHAEAEKHKPRWVERGEFLHHRYKAATVLSSAWRGLQGRRTADARRPGFLAARRIQARARGFLWRRRFPAFRGRVRYMRGLQALQSWVRIVLAKRRAREERLARRLQGVVRMWRTRKHVDSVHALFLRQHLLLHVQPRVSFRCAALIQARFRGRRARVAAIEAMLLAEFG